MTNRELIWRRARNWVSGWQAAVRQMRKGTPLMPGNITTQMGKPE